MGSYDSFKAGRPKPEYTRTVTHSHYSSPVDHTKGRSAGNSRRWGDASSDVQEKVIEATVNSCRTRGLNLHDAARVLAIVRAESGFNPDAASGLSSAAGGGQFTDDTRTSYGIKRADMFSIESNADGVVAYFLKCKNKAKAEGIDGVGLDERTYKYYHDGINSENKDSGGVRAFWAPDSVYQWIHRIEDALIQNYVPSANNTPDAEPPRMARALPDGQQAYGEDDDYHPDCGMSM